MVEVGSKRSGANSVALTGCKSAQVVYYMAAMTKGLSVSLTGSCLRSLAWSAEKAKEEHCICCPAQQR